jgi:hypothetical protein
MNVEMMFWLVGANAPIIKNVFQMPFRMSTNSDKNLGYTSEHSMLSTKVSWRNDISCGLRKNTKTNVT